MIFIVTSSIKIQCAFRKTNFSYHKINKILHYYLRLVYWFNTIISPKHNTILFRSYINATLYLSLYCMHMYNGSKVLQYEYSEKKESFSVRTSLHFICTIHWFCFIHNFSLTLWNKKQEEKKYWKTWPDFKKASNIRFFYESQGWFSISTILHSIIALSICIQFSSI